jgi:hypothetical protein
MARMTPWREWTGTSRGLVLCSLVALAFGVTAAVRFAPEPRTRVRQIQDSAVEREARQAKAYHEQAWRGVRTVQLRDSLRALARPGVTYLLDPRIAPDKRDEAKERLVAAWRPFAAQAPRVPVVLYLHTATKASGTRPFGDPAFVALPTAPGEPCVASVATLFNWRTVARDARWMRYGLYGCALMAELGFPGAGVQAELRRIAWSPTPLVLERRFWYYTRSGSTLNVASTWIPDSYLSYLACAASLPDGCRALAAQPLVRSRELPPGTMRSWRTASDWSLLAFLKASVTPADFQRLWSDDRSFAVAVESITGKPIEDWTRLAILRTGAPLESVSSPTTPLLGRAFLLLLLAIATSTAVQTRRTVR